MKASADAKVTPSQGELSGATEEVTPYQQIQRRQVFQDKRDSASPSNGSSEEVKKTPPAIPGKKSRTTKITIPIKTTKSKRDKMRKNSFTAIENTGSKTTPISLIPSSPPLQTKESENFQSQIPTENPSGEVAAISLGELDIIEDVPAHQEKNIPISKNNALPPKATLIDLGLDKIKSLAPEQNSEIQTLRKEITSLKAELDKKETSDRASQNRFVKEREFLNLRETINRKDQSLLLLRDQIGEKSRAVLEAEEQIRSLEHINAEHESKMLDLERKLLMNAENADTYREEIENQGQALAKLENSIQKERNEFDNEKQRIEAKHEKELVECQRTHKNHLSEIKNEVKKQKEKLCAQHRELEDTLRQKLQQKLIETEERLTKDKKSALAKRAQEEEDKTKSIMEKHANAIDEIISRHGQEEQVLKSRICNIQEELRQCRTEASNVESSYEETLRKKEKDHQESYSLLQKKLGEQEQEAREFKNRSEEKLAIVKKLGIEAIQKLQSKFDEQKENHKIAINELETTHHNAIDKKINEAETAQRKHTGEIRVLEEKHQEAQIKSALEFQEKLGAMEFIRSAEKEQAQAQKTLLEEEKEKLGLALETAKDRINQVTHFFLNAEKELSEQKESIEKQAELLKKRLTLIQSLRQKQEHLEDKIAILTTQVERHQEIADKTHNSSQIAKSALEKALEVLKDNVETLTGLQKDPEDFDTTETSLSLSELELDDFASECNTQVRAKLPLEKKELSRDSRTND